MRETAMLKAEVREDVAEMVARTAELRMCSKSDVLRDAIVEYFARRQGQPEVPQQAPAKEGSAR